MTDETTSFLREAIRIAEENVKKGGGPFGAIVVKDGQILATGVNRVTAELDPTAHAEIKAIRSACQALGSFQLTGCTLYCSCEPCPMCLGAIYWARPDRVYYAASKSLAAKAGFDDALIYRELDLPPDHRQIPMLQACRNEAENPFHLWMEKEEKQEY